jgi:dimethylaniline monooxygenase (N-oxide forming)
MKNMVVTSSGSPEQFGAPKPDDNIFAAGLTQSQNYLALVAEGRIQPRPWIERADGRTVYFADGASEALDAIIFGTGFKLSLPFLGNTIAAILGLDADHIELHDHTLHPDLDGLYFIGLYPLVGPYFPVLELQARWLAYLWAGLRPVPSVEAMKQGVATVQARRDGPQEAPMHVPADLFARNAGVEPDPAAWPELERALWFGRVAGFVPPDRPRRRSGGANAHRRFGARLQRDRQPGDHGRGGGKAEGRVSIARRKRRLTAPIQQRA